MKHSKRVHEAAQQVLAELLALTPKELDECLQKRQMGEVGFLIKETDALESFYSTNTYYGMSPNTYLMLNSMNSSKKADDYASDSSIDEHWLEAA